MVTLHRSAINTDSWIGISKTNRSGKLGLFRPLVNCISNQFFPISLWIKNDSLIFIADVKTIPRLLIVSNIVQTHGAHLKSSVKFFNFKVCCVLNTKLLIPNSQPTSSQLYTLELLWWIWIDFCLLFLNTS